jgi:hypothetical protein
MGQKENREDKGDGAILLSLPRFNFLRLMLNRTDAVKLNCNEYS